MSASAVVLKPLNLYLRMYYAIPERLAIGLPLRARNDLCISPSSLTTVSHLDWHLFQTSILEKVVNIAVKRHGLRPKGPKSRQRC